jgi:type II secretory pathway component GspD/PulD (secretin)
MTRKRVFVTTTLVGFLVPCLLPVHGQENADDDQTVAIYEGVNLPVLDLAKALEAFLQGTTSARAGEGPVVIPESISNSLIIRGTAKAVERVHELLKQLDQKPASVFVEVVIVNVESDKKPARVAIGGDGQTTADELTEALSKQGRMQVLVRAQLMALHNQSAYLQIGRRKPRVTAVRGSSQGTARSVEMENVGLTLGLTPRVTPEGNVAIEVDLERSDLAEQEDGIELSPAGDRAVGVANLSLQTTLSARSGQMVVLGGLTEGSEGRWQKLVALLTPTVIE